MPGPLFVVPAIAALAFAASAALAAPVNKCVVDGSVTYQQAPCPTGRIKSPPSLDELNVAEKKRRAAAAATSAVPVAPVPRDASAGFRCDGRTYCSQMTSCAEAMYFLARCPGVKMDGDRNGIPCEQQWCTR